jgi:hypothetical protein
MSAMRPLPTGRRPDTALRPATVAQLLPVASPTASGSVAAAVGAGLGRPQLSGHPTVRGAFGSTVPARRAGSTPAPGRTLPGAVGAIGDVTKSVATDPPRAAGGVLDIAMPEYHAVLRRATLGAAPARGSALASAFGAAEIITPAGAGRAPQPARRAPAPSAAGARGRPSGPVPLRDAGPLAGPDRVGGPPVRYLPAPPRLSVRRSTASVGADAPAQRSAGPAGPPFAPESLVRRTTQLFADAAAADIARTLATSMAEPEGGTMSETRPADAQRLTRDSPPAQDNARTEGLLQSPQFLEQLVDKVVDRIERKVVDELERRGRRHGRGAF